MYENVERRDSSTMLELAIMFCMWPEGKVLIKRFFKTKIIEIQTDIYNGIANNASFLDFFLAVIFVYATSAAAYDLVLSSS
jgi:hypothetical protein